eukprot:13929235-Heterocapsa_arctica.AAC.1
MKLKAKKNHKQNLRHHQDRVNFFWEKYRRVSEDIYVAYAELEELGWTLVTYHESDNAASQSSDEAPRYIEAIAEAERKQHRARETSAERRQQITRKGELLEDPILIDSDKEMPDNI